MSFTAEQLRQLGAPSPSGLSNYIARPEAQSFGVRLSDANLPDLASLQFNNASDLYKQTLIPKFAVPDNKGFWASAQSGLNNIGDGIKGFFGMDTDASQPKANGAKTDTGDMSWGDWGNLGLKAFESFSNYNNQKSQMDILREGIASNERQFANNYNATRDLTNAGIYDKNVRRNIEMGQDLNTARTNSQAYVDERGIKALA